MDKIIKLTMLDNKDIKVEVDQDEALTIPSNERQVNAQQIYELFKFDPGDVFKLEKENPKDLDKPVLDYFFELLETISNKVNELSLGLKEDAEDDCENKDKWYA